MEESIFDPLGLLAPILLQAKLLLRETWCGFEDVVLSLPVDANMSELDTHSTDVVVSVNLVLLESHATAQSHATVHPTESSDHLVEYVLHPNAHHWNLACWEIRC